MNNYKTKTNSIIKEGSEITNSEQDPIDIFTGGLNIINISIQGPPGLEFYINENKKPIVINSNGFFQWQINQPNVYIEKMSLEKNSFNNNFKNEYIIITYEYIIEE